MTSPTRNRTSYLAAPDQLQTGGRLGTAETRWNDY